jgi:hypothetical protein
LQTPPTFGVLCDRSTKYTLQIMKKGPAVSQPFGQKQPQGVTARL